MTSLAGTAGSGTLNDVATGAIADLRVSGISGSVALSCDVAATSLSDAGPLVPGAGAYYLVRGRNICDLGVWGDASDGMPRILTVCP